MARKEEIIELIREAFGRNPYPGDAFLQGSFDGCEPYDEVSAFFGQTDWTKLASTMLDGHYCALSFFSEGGFRFFLPAYLIADLNGELLTADPLFHLWHGFSTVSAQIPVGSQTFERRSGGANLLNPKRYGAMTWIDHARHRLSVFTREEAQAIVAYMTYKREHDEMGLDRSRIDAALAGFWLDRAENAPTRELLQGHLQKEEEFAAAFLRDRGERDVTVTPGKRARIASGITLLMDVEGHGPAAAKGNKVVFNMKLWLNRGDEVPLNAMQSQHLPEHMIRIVEGETLIDHTSTLGRREVIAGVERSLMGMRAGGYRKVQVSPHLAYREKGLPGLIPENALLVIEIWLREIRPALDRCN